MIKNKNFRKNIVKVLTFLLKNEIMNQIWNFKEEKRHGNKSILSD